MAVIQALCGAFFAVLFLQAGLDKVLDRAGQVARFTEVTARGPLRRWPRAALNLVTLLELLAGSVSAAGLVLWSLGGDSAMLLGGAVLAAAHLLLLFLGQRLARDDAGAAGIVPYFLVALAAIAAQR